MKRSNLHDLRESACAPRRFAIKEADHLLCRSLAFVLSILAITSTGLAAQTESSRSAAIHNHLQKAEAYLKANDPDSAVKEFNTVLALDTKNSEAYANLGVIAFFQHDYQSASQNFRKALAINPSLTKTEALLGVSKRRLGDPSARKLLEESFPKLKDAKLRLQVGLELAGIYEEQGNSGATASVMQSLVELDPDNVEVLFMAQRVYAELADETLNKLAVVAPGSARMQQVIAQRLVNAGDLHNAIDHYRRALEIDSRLPGVHFELAQAILESDWNDSATQASAEKEFEAAIAADGDSSSIECKLGRIAMLRSDLDSAYGHYARSVELNPHDSEAQLGLGTVFMMKGDLERAKKYLELAVLSDPLNETTHYRLARVYRDLHLTEQAQKEVKLSKEIKDTKDQVAALYRQMNQRPAFERGQVPDALPTAQEE
jgi:Tfp pilus assembly protein PilF